PTTPAFAISPNYASDHTLWFSVLYGATDIRVYRSANGGGSWTQSASVGGVSGDAPFRLVPSPGFAADHLLLLTTGKFIFRSTDAGSTFPGLNSATTAVPVFSPRY